MKLIKTEDAVGHVLVHDMTMIVPGTYKGARFKKGHIVCAEDIPVLLSMGKEHLYVWENGENMLHEDEAAAILAAACGSVHMTHSKPSEGKIELTAACDGVLKVNRRLLEAINSLGEMMIATRHGNTFVRKGDKLAGTRIIPLVIEKSKMEPVRTLSQEEHVLSLLPVLPKKAAVITTGNEVKSGRIQDAFTPAVEKKLTAFGSEIIFRSMQGDDPDQTSADILEAIGQGAELVLCTGGMSVDPDDKTPLAIKRTGAEIISYGAPVLPGAMFLLAYYGEKRIPVLGLPGCVMYAQRTVFDLVLPRLLSDDPVTAQELARLGEGGLCLGCEICTYPNCGFGKGW